MTRLAIAIVALSGAGSFPAFAASGPFLSLNNTNFVVLISFILFIGTLLYFKAPGIVASLLDKQIEQIRSKLAETSAIHEDAKSLLDRCQSERKAADDDAKRIFAAANEQAEMLVENAKVDIKGAVARRLAAAEEQIESAEASAIAEIRNKASEIAVFAAGQIIAENLDSADRDRLFDQSIKDVRTHLN